MPDEQISVKDVFAAMPNAFKPEAAAGVDVVFQYNISGPGGGDWIVTVKDQTCEVTEGQAESPTTTIKMAEEDFLAMLSGQLQPMTAFTSGKLKIEGDMMKAQLVATLFEQQT
jgi:putative sterol carrier protein